MPQGTVVTLVDEKGFGFIRADGKNKGKDLFFHATGMVNRDDFAELKTNQRVEFEVDDSGDRPRAVKVQAIED